MVLKICGIIMIIASSSLMGLYFANKDFFRISDLRQMKKALGILKSEIGYTLTPLPLAMGNIAQKTDAPVSNIFSAFSEAGFSLSRDGAYEIWLAALSQSRKELYYEEEDYEAFKSFGKTLGYLDKSMQINNIELTISYLDEKIAGLKESGAKNKKLYGSLGVLGGLFICVILI